MWLVSESPAEMWGFFNIFIYSFKIQNMKAKGTNNYSKKELRTIKTMMMDNKKTVKPMSIVKLSKFVAAQLKRPSSGVYIKMLDMSTQRAKRQPVVTKKVSTPPMSTKSVTFGKPTKIEISDKGMTFFF